MNIAMYKWICNFSFLEKVYVKVKDFLCVAIFGDVTYSMSKLPWDSRWTLCFSDFWLCSEFRGTGEVSEYCGVLEDSLVSNWSDNKDVRPKGCWNCF